MSHRQDLDERNHEFYLSAKAQTENLARGLSETDLARTCDSCPEWSIKDVIAHHIHAQRSYNDETWPPEVVAAFQEADAEEYKRLGKIRDEWTASGVEARRTKTLDELFEEWGAVVEAAGGDGYLHTLDLTMHLFDIRETLGDETGRTSDLVTDALWRFERYGLGPTLEKVGLSVHLECTDSGDVFGDPESVYTVSGTAYDLLRCVGGRRTRAQADETLEWGDTPEAIRELFSVYTWPTEASTHRSGTGGQPQILSMCLECGLHPVGL